MLSNHTCSCSLPTARSFRATIDLASTASSFDTVAVGTALSDAASGKTGANRTTACVLFEDFTVTFNLSASATANSTTTDGGDNSTQSGEHGDNGHHTHWDTVDADGNIPVTDGTFLLPVPGINTATSLRVHLDLGPAQTVTATVTGFLPASGDNVVTAAAFADLVPTILLLGSQWAATVGKHEQTLVITSSPVLGASYVIRASAPVTAGNALTRLTSAVDTGSLSAAIANASAGISFVQNPTAPVRVLVPITLSSGANGTTGDINASSVGGAPGSQVAIIATTSFTLNVTTAGGANTSAIAGAVQQGVSDSLNVPPDAVDVTVAPSTPATDNGTVTSVVTVTVQHGSIGDYTLPGGDTNSSALAPSAAPSDIGGANSTSASNSTAVPVTASSESTAAVAAPAVNSNSTDAAQPAAPAAAAAANVTAFTASVQDIIQNAVPQAVQAALAAGNLTNATVQAPSSSIDVSTSAAVPLAGSDVSAASQVAGTQTTQRSGTGGGGSPIGTPSVPPLASPPPAGFTVDGVPGSSHSGSSAPRMSFALVVLIAVMGAAL